MASQEGGGAAGCGHMGSATCAASCMAAAGMRGGAGADASTQRVAAVRQASSVHMARSGDGACTAGVGGALRGKGYARSDVRDGWMSGDEESALNTTGGMAEGGGTRH